MESIIERFYRNDSDLFESGFFKEYHKKEAAEIERDIEYDQKKLKKILMKGKALSEEKAKEIIKKIEQDYERLYPEYAFDEFACGWKMGAALMLELLRD